MTLALSSKLGIIKIFSFPSNFFRNNKREAQLHKYLTWHFANWLLLCILE